MKTTKIFRIAALMFSLTLVTSCFVGETFAYFASTKSATDSARYAKWSFKVNDLEIANNAEWSTYFNIFETINDTNKEQSGKETDVKSGEIIAPGTVGSYPIKIENSSEVNATYTIDFVENNAKDIPVQYKIDYGDVEGSWYDSVEELEAAMDKSIDLTDKPIAVGETHTYTFYWRWAYNDSDSVHHKGQTNAVDTALGVNTAYLSVNAKITASQVD